MRRGRTRPKVRSRVGGGAGSADLTLQGGKPRVFPTRSAFGAGRCLGGEGEARRGLELGLWIESEQNH